MNNLTLENWSEHFDKTFDVKPSLTYDREPIEIWDGYENGIAPSPKMVKQFIQTLLDLKEEEMKKAVVSDLTRLRSVRVDVHERFNAISLSQLKLDDIEELITKYKG